MELTPSKSAASLASSQKNLSKDQIANTSAVKGSAVLESEPRFGNNNDHDTGNKNEENVYYSNNSLMNP